MTTHLLEPVTFGELPLRIEDVLALANRQAPTRLQDDAGYRQRIAKGAQFLDSLLDKEGVIYGVTTGYGDSCVVAVPLQHVEALPRHLYTFHGCGLGKLLDAQATRAVLAARLQSLCHGVSGVRVELLSLWFPSRYRARMIASFYLGVPIAQIIGAPLSVGVWSIHADVDLARLGLSGAGICVERRLG